MNIALLSFSYYPANEYASEQLWVWNTEFSIDYICVAVRKRSAIACLFDVAFVWRYNTRPRLKTKLAERGLLSS